MRVQVLQCACLWWLLCRIRCPCGDQRPIAADERRKQQQTDGPARSSTWMDDVGVSVHLPSEWYPTKRKTQQIIVCTVLRVLTVNRTVSLICPWFHASCSWVLQWAVVFAPNLGFSAWRLSSVPLRLCSSRIGNKFIGNVPLDWRIGSNSIFVSARTMVGFSAAMKSCGCPWHKDCSHLRYLPSSLPWHTHLTFGPPEDPRNTYPSMNIAW